MFVIKFFMEMFEVFVTIRNAIIYILLSMFNERIIHITIFDDKNNSLHLIPLGRKFMVFKGLYLKNLIERRFYEQIDIYMIRFTFVKSSKVMHGCLLKKNMRELEDFVTNVRISDVNDKQKFFRNKFLFVEINGNNFTKEFLNISWSIGQKFKAKHFKMICGITDKDSTVDITDGDDFNVDERKDDDALISI